MAPLVEYSIYLSRGVMKVVNLSILFFFILFFTHWCSEMEFRVCTMCVHTIYWPVCIVFLNLCVTCMQ